MCQHRANVIRSTYVILPLMRRLFDIGPTLVRSCYANSNLKPTDRYPTNVGPIFHKELHSITGCLRINFNFICKRLKSTVPFSKNIKGPRMFYFSNNKFNFNYSLCNGKMHDICLVNCYVNDSNDVSVKP